MVNAAACTIELWMHLGGLLSTQEALEALEAFVLSNLPHAPYNNYSMSSSWIWRDKITNERVARVGYNQFITNKGEWNNCFSKFSNQVLPPIFISAILQSVRKEHTTSGHTRPDSRHLLIIT